MTSTNAPLEKSVFVRCNVDHAFAVFTQRVHLWWPPGHKKWADSTLHLDARVGGVFEERAADGACWRLGEVIECQPPHHIRYTWTPGMVDGPTDVSVTFSAHEGGTLVEVTHQAGQDPDGFPLRRTVFTTAWDRVLTAFHTFTTSTPDAL